MRSWSQADALFLSRRREAVSRHETQIGIDYVQVTRAPGAGQWMLALHFIPAAPLLPYKTVRPDPTPRPDQVTIAGVAPLIGTDLQVVSVENSPTHGDQLCILIGFGQGGAQGIRDVPNYVLTLTGVTNLDPFFDQVEFSLTTDAASAFEFRRQPPRAVRPPLEPVINYLAKDYASFRQLMLDRLSLIMPQWTETNPSDIGMTLVEVLAYAADQLSYYQDAIATEAYLGTARQRISVRRHARLLDYSMNEGCDARVWIHIQVTAETCLAGGTPLLTSVWGEPPSLYLTGAEVAEAIGRGAQVFETTQSVSLYPVQNCIQFYTWGARDYSLPTGATSATLYDQREEMPHAPWLSKILQVGDVLIFEEIRSPQSGTPPDPTHRHAVRLTEVEPGTDPLGGQFDDPSQDASVPIVTIAWAAEDALPFPLPVSSSLDPDVGPMGVARGNIVLADHGRTIGLEPLPEVPPSERYTPALEHRNLTYRVPYSGSSPTVPASLTVQQSPQAALPAITLESKADRRNDHHEAPPRMEGQQWTAQPDLLGSAWYSREFVVEMENDRTARLRFGDGVLGMKPTPRDAFVATYRVGNGTPGNVGADTIVHYSGATPNLSIRCVRNPLPAQGGTDPEALEQVRLNAPQAFHTQERCVTEVDCAAIAERHPEVKEARAARQWTGSWDTVFLAVHRRNNLPVDQTFADTITAYMQPYLLTGTDVRVLPPTFVPLDIALTVHIDGAHVPGIVKQALLEAFSDVALPNARLGFFYPDNFTFGRPVYLSEIVQRATQVPGVVWLEATRFQRWQEPPRGELVLGHIPIGPWEIARLDNNPAAPEYGQIAFTIEGA